MGKVYVTEFSQIGVDTKDRVLQAALVSSNNEPITQILQQTGSSVQSTDAFHRNTNLIRICTDVAINFTFGVNPTANLSDMYMPADSTEYFSVMPGDNLKIAIL